MLLSFAAAVFFMIVTPGPGVLSTAGVGAAFGFRAGLAYVTGLFLGTTLVALAVITGLAAIMLNVPLLRTILGVASAIYLCYLAAKIAFAGTKIAFIEAKSPPGVWNGVMLQFINPKAYAVNTTLFANFAFAGWPIWAEQGTKLLVASLIWIPLHLAWLWAGVALHRLDRRKEALRFLRSAVDIDPNFTIARNNLGVLLYELGDVAGAVTEFEIAYALTNGLDRAIATNLGIAETATAQTEVETIVTEDNVTFDVIRFGHGVFRLTPRDAPPAKDPT